jgi:integrase
MLAGRSMENVLRVLRIAKSFFGDNFVPNFSFIPTLFKRKSAPRKVCVPFEQTNVLKLLESINTDDGEGLRDFAIILLGACLGIRACDIIQLKLTDFNWKDKVLNFVQHKTGKPQILPIDGIVGDAVATYILNGRPESHSEYIFLRCIPPHYPFKNGSSISDMLRKRLKKLGINHCKGDGMTFHGLRRSIATEMVKEGTPVSIVAEVLGHSNIKPTRQYIGLDLENLRKCTLDLLFPKGL